MSQKNKRENSYYRKPDKPAYTRRAFHHDYTRPARYMITLRKASGIPVLATVSGNLKVADPLDSDFPKAIPNNVGNCFTDACRQWCEQYPQIRIDAAVVMPDHIHFCIQVTHGLPNGLSRAIASLMGKTTKLYRNTSPVDKSEIPFFHKGFTDSIAYTDAQYHAQLCYVADNPRRLLMKRLFPDLYRMRWIIRIGELKLLAVGNIYLLKNPDLQVVRFSRRFTKDEIRAKREAWQYCVENGGALISPFIHHVENDMRKTAMSQNGNIIRICENGFSERFSPNKSEFELMGTRHLLLIGPFEYKSEKTAMKYTYAQYLNSIASLLASRPPGMRIYPFKPQERNKCPIVARTK